MGKGRHSLGSFSAPPRLTCGTDSARPCDRQRPRHSPRSHRTQDPIVCGQREDVKVATQLVTLDRDNDLPRLAKLFLVKINHLAERMRHGKLETVNPVIRELVEMKSHMIRIRDDYSSILKKLKKKESANHGVAWETRRNMNCQIKRLNDAALKLKEYIKASNSEEKLNELRSLVNQAANVLEKLERKTKTEKGPKKEPQNVLEKLERKTKTEKGPKKEPQNEMKNNAVEERKVLKSLQNEALLKQNDSVCKEVHNDTLELQKLRLNHGNISDELNLRLSCWPGDLVATPLQQVTECRTSEEKFLLLEEEIVSRQNRLTLAYEKLKKIVSLSEYEDKWRMDLRQQNLQSAKRIVDLQNVLPEILSTLLEIKGNIRVFCRVRPTPTLGEAICIAMSGENIGHAVELMHKGIRQKFVFDQVFGPSASQQDVFKPISELVQTALDGFKVCILAYGQSGSGKTHTMMGKKDDEGLIPRALAQIFEATSDGLEVRIEVEILEVYNSVTYDLLEIQEGKALKLKLVSHPKVIIVSSTEEVLKLLKNANKLRHVSKTELNDESSRSHLVFKLRFPRIEEGSAKKASLKKGTASGVLCLVDLAGTERINESHVSGPTLAEARAINASLFSLRLLIDSLSGGSLPNYRDSQLTLVLEDCLCKKSKALMLVTVSGKPSAAQASFTTLDFGRKVKKCELGS